MRMTSHRADPGSLLAPSATLWGHSRRKYLNAHGNNFAMKLLLLLLIINGIDSYN